MSKYEELKKALETLGLPVFVTYKEIKERYHQLIHEFHPDKVSCNKEIYEINSAFNELKEYIENYRFSFSFDEYIKQHPEELYATRFKF